jgi:hypothetical protein
MKTLQVYSCEDSNKGDKADLQALLSCAVYSIDAFLEDWRNTFVQSVKLPFYFCSEVELLSHMRFLYLALKVYIIIQAPGVMCRWNIR